MSNHKIISVRKEQLTTELTDQIYFEVSESDKFEALCRIIDIEKDFYGLIFCRTKNDVEEVANKLIDRGYDAEALHGDISQYNRERIMKKFKEKRITILVATDVAARGLDIYNLSHVINYSLPQDPESYVHRIGRTGRAGKEGTAITFVTPEEYRKLIFIKKIAKTDIRKEKLPKIKDIIKVKKERIKNEILEIMKEENYNDYLEMAKELIVDNPPEAIIASLLQYSFKDELNEKNYMEIKEISSKSSSVDTKGKTRLFVALGRENDMTPKKLVNFIKQEAEIDERKIQEIKIFDKFSFVTVPFEEAEIILNIFKTKNRKKPIIVKAKEKKD